MGTRSPQRFAHQLKSSTHAHPCECMMPFVTGPRMMAVYAHDDLNSLLLASVIRLPRACILAEVMEVR